MVFKLEGRGVRHFGFLFFIDMVYAQFSAAIACLLNTNSTPFYFLIYQVHHINIHGQDSVSLVSSISLHIIQQIPQTEHKRAVAARCTAM